MAGSKDARNMQSCASADLHSCHKLQMGSLPANRCYDACMIVWLVNRCNDARMIVCLLTGVTAPA